MAEEQAGRDRRWCEWIDAGDVAALEAVYDAYAGAVYRQAMAVLGSVADAEDVVQEVFLHLVRRRGGPIRDLKAYLLTAARRQSCSTLRRRRQDELAAAVEAPRPVPSVCPSALTDGEVIRQALRALPSRQRDVVFLKVYEQLTFEEIGRVVRASANTVASRYRYALQKLRRALGDSCDV
jgi:RNA polymerase sigma-70 factor, ECF subfamily